MVVLVEVMRRNYLASIVPVIVNAVLNEHQVIVDIVAFVAKGDFPRSRLGEKQRGKILASWVTRKMETIAQFSIRDADGADSQITEVAEPRSTVGSVRIGSSLKNVQTIASAPPRQQDYNDLINAPSELPAPYESSIVESPPLPREEDERNIPTDFRANPYAVDDELHIHRAELGYNDNDYPERTRHEPQRYDFDDLTTPQHDHDPSAFSFPASNTPAPLDPHYESTPSLSLPSFSEDRGLAQDGNHWAVANQQHPQGSSYASGTGDRNGESFNGADGADWPQEALMHMNLGGGGRAEDRYDGSGYGHAL